MPGRDRTGPQGIGPMSGWGTGYCAGNRAETGNFGGRGWQRGGAGGGHGRCKQFYATGQPGWMRSGWGNRPSPTQEAQALKDQAEALESELKLVMQRLDEVESAEKAK